MDRDEKKAFLNAVCKPILGALKGKKMPFQSANTYMVVFIGSNDKICLRLPVEKYLNLSQIPSANHSKEHGSMMKDFIVIPDDLLTSEGVLENLLNASLKHVNSLKPKYNAK